MTVSTPLAALLAALPVEIPETSLASLLRSAPDPDAPVKVPDLPTSRSFPDILDKLVDDEKAPDEKHAEAALTPAPFALPVAIVTPPPVPVPPMAPLMDTELRPAAAPLTSPSAGADTVLAEWAFEAPQTVAPPGVQPADTVLHPDTQNSVPPEKAADPVVPAPAAPLPSPAGTQACAPESETAEPPCPRSAPAAREKIIFAERPHSDKTESSLAPESQRAAAPLGAPAPLHPEIGRPAAPSLPASQDSVSEALASPALPQLEGVTPQVPEAAPARKQSSLVPSGGRKSDNPAGKPPAVVRPERQPAFTAVNLSSAVGMPPPIPGVRPVIDESSPEDTRPSPERPAASGGQVAPAVPAVASSERADRPPAIAVVEAARQYPATCSPGGPTGSERMPTAFDMHLTSIEPEQSSDVVNTPPPSPPDRSSGATSVRPPSVPSAKEAVTPASPSPDPVVPGPAPASRPQVSGDRGGPVTEGTGADEQPPKVRRPASAPVAPPPPRGLEPCTAFHAATPLESRPAAATRPESSPPPHEPVRTAPEPPTPLVRPAPSVRDIQFALNSSDRRVEVRLVEHAGEVRVDVRTPDTRLAAELRSDLPALSAKLESAGFRTEAWRPAGVDSAERQRIETSTAPASQQAGDRPRQEHGGRQPDGREETPRPTQDIRKQQKKEFAWLLSTLR